MSTAHTTPLDDVENALNAAVSEGLGLFDETIAPTGSPHAMWRDRIQRTLGAVTDRADMSAPFWSTGRLQGVHLDLSRLGLTMPWHVPCTPRRQESSRRVLVPSPTKVVKAFGSEDG